MGLLCKIVGGVFVMGATGYLAFSVNQTFEQRKQELRKLYSILLQLKSEIQYMCNPLPESFEKLAQGANDPFASWLYSIAGKLDEKQMITFEVAWVEGLEMLSLNSSLNKGDIDPLYELKDKLGSGDVTAQLRAIDYALLHIEGCRTILEGELEQKKKVTFTLSLFCGAMTLLLLL